MFKIKEEINCRIYDTEEAECIGLYKARSDCGTTVEHHLFQKSDGELFEVLKDLKTKSLSIKLFDHFYTMAEAILNSLLSEADDAEFIGIDIKCRKDTKTLYFDYLFKSSSEKFYGVTYEFKGADVPVGFTLRNFRYMGFSPAEYFFEE